MRILSFISHGDDSGALASQIAQQARLAGEGDVAVVRIVSSDIANLRSELERQHRDGLALAVIEACAENSDAAEQAISYADLVAIPTLPDPDRLDAVKGTLDAVEMRAKPFVFIINVPSTDRDLDPKTGASIVLCQYGTMSPVSLDDSDIMPGTAANEDVAMPPADGAGSEIAELWDYLRARLHKVAPEDGNIENRRQYHRWERQTLAQLTINGGLAECTLANISGGGALIKTEAIANLGDILFITNPEIGDFEAEIRHIDAKNMLGVEFVTDAASKERLSETLASLANANENIGDT